MKKNFNFLYEEKRLQETSGSQFDYSFQHHKVLLKFIHRLDSVTNYSSVCPTLNFLASAQALMTNITYFLSKFVRFLNTPFSRTYYCFKFILHQHVFSGDILWQFCRESKMFSWPLILWFVFLPISFYIQKQFFPILKKTLLQSSYFGTSHSIKADTE